MNAIHDLGLLNIFADKYEKDIKCALKKMMTQKESPALYLPDEKSFISAAPHDMNIVTVGTSKSM